MAKLGIHKRGHGKEKLMGDSVSHHPAKDAFNESAGSLNSPMTSPVHPDLTSMAGGPSMPSSTPAADSNMSSMASSPEMGAAPSTPAASGMGFKKGGRVKYAEGSKWIQGAIKHPGALRASLHVKAGEKIPAKKLSAAAKKPGEMGKRARLAQTLKGFKK